MIESKQTVVQQSFIKLLPIIGGSSINTVDLQMRDCYRDEYIHVRNTVGDN